MAQGTGQLLPYKKSGAGRWLGRVLKIVDGTTVSMPDTQENQQIFPQQPNLEAGVGFPLARVVVLTNMSAGGLLDAAMGPCENKGSNEHGGCDTYQRYIYIHGTPDSEPMGAPYSHGCIRMRNDEIIELFAQVQEGTLVTIVES